jgi:hypothetical protein
MNAPIRTGLEPIIEALQACRAELADSNTRAAQIEAAREHLAECEARLDAYPPAPTTDRHGCVLRYANWLRGRDPLVRDMRAAREYLNDLLQSRQHDDDYSGNDETHERPDYRSWQEVESDEVGIPLRGEI